MSRTFAGMRLVHSMRRPQLSLTSDGWNNLGFGAGPTVRPMVEAGLNVDLSSFDHFALVIDKFDAALAAVSPTFPIYVHVGAQSLDPALVQPPAPVSL